MAEVLSQSEIDSLLSALSSGEMDAEELKKEDTEKKVKIYDFKRALRFSKDQIRSLTRLHENYARLLTTGLSGLLRTFVKITVASVDQLPYDEFIRSVPQMTVMNVFEASPLEGRLVMELNPQVAYAMLDRLMGGPGVGQSSVSSLTEIETMIMERIFEHALRTFEEAWESVIDTETRVDVLELNPQFLQIVSPNETVAVISLNAKIGDTTGMINLCLPHVVLEPIMPKLTAHYWLANRTKHRDEKELETIRARLQKASIPLIAQLGTSQISVEELLRLNVGDVIQLNESTNEMLKVKVGEKVKFRGQPGTVKNRLAVQIHEVIDEGNDEDE